MKQKLYALDTFFIEKLKLSENDPQIRSDIYIQMKKEMHRRSTIMTLIYSSEVSINQSNYKSQKSIKMLNKLSVQHEFGDRNFI